jgi:hypothetical protein
MWLSPSNYVHLIFGTLYYIWNCLIQESAHYLFLTLLELRNISSASVGLRSEACLLRAQQCYVRYMKTYELKVMTS